MIYLDNAATTKVDSGVAIKMLYYMTDIYGNPGSTHIAGKTAGKAVAESRELIAEFIGANPENIIFTSGGSEANTLAIIGVADWLEKTHRKHIVCSSIEHHSVMAALDKLKQRGFDITYVNPNRLGVVRIESVIDAIREDTGLVCVMAANNETGAVNNVSGIGAYCAVEGILFFTDCVQAAGSVTLNIEEANPYCDLMSLSSHKIHGPKGVGALYCRNMEVLSPVVYGGSDQEYGLRGGTENVPGIVGFAEASRIIMENFPHISGKIGVLKQAFYNALIEKLPEDIADTIQINGLGVNSCGKVLSITFPGVDGETLLMLLSSNGVCASAGSACNSLEQKPSYVLTAMGLTGEQARSTVRFSFSRMNSVSEVERAASIVANCVSILRSGDIDGG